MEVIDHGGGLGVWWRWSNILAESLSPITVDTTYTSIGGGGGQTPSRKYRKEYYPGSNSVFANPAAPITSTGGGGGGAGGDGQTPGRPGGSGGGGAAYNGPTQPGGSGTANQGFDGGSASSSGGTLTAKGGGGAGQCWSECKSRINI